MRRWVVLASPLVCLVAAALAVAIGAIRWLCVFTARELAFFCRAPVVASSTWPEDPGALDDLLADIELAWGRPSGETLVLPFGEAEAMSADTLVDKLVARGLPGAARAPSGLTTPALRRAVRGASRVLVLVSSGRRSGLSLSSIEATLGRREGVGFLLIGLGKELVELPYREGDVDGFWRGSQAETRLSQAERRGFA